MNTHHDILVTNLRKHSQTLALPLGRKVGSNGHAVTLDYLRHRMKRTHLQPFKGDSYELCYEGIHPNTKEKQQFTNLVGVIPGKDRSLPPILVGAHYDSVIDAPCVDDNATSVAKTLVIAETYALRPLERDLIIAFFDAEEPPFFLSTTMGSRRFCEDHCQEIQFAAVIITDLIGHDASLEDFHIDLPKLAKPIADFAVRGLKNTVAVIGAETNGTFPTIIEAAAKAAKDINVLPTHYGYVGPVSDHAAFSQAGQPFLFLSCGQGKYYHHPQDDMEWINFDKLAHITRFIGDIIERIDKTPPYADVTPVDPFDLEIKMLRDIFGPMLPLGLKYMGMKMPQSREELDTIIDTTLHGIPHKSRT